MHDTPKSATYLYLKLTLAFSALIWALIIWSGHLLMGFGLMAPVIMWCPALAALATCRKLGRESGSLAWHPLCSTHSLTNASLRFFSARLTASLFSLS